MALQVWLPLNKDFNNKGLDNNVTVNTTNLTIAGGGKLGHYVQVTSSKKIALSSMPYMAPSADNEMSIAMWVNAATFNYIIAFGAFELRIVANAAFFRTGDGTSPYTIAAQYNSTFSTGTWYHICGTWSSREGRVRLYIDGNLVAENNNRPGDYKSPSSSMNLVYGGDWQISDFRIYDNEISPQDVKEIYWGKVLEFTPQWKHSGELSVLGDASGLNYPLTPYDVTLSNNIAQFNGTSSYVGFSSPNILGGSVSIWFSTPTKPNSGYRFLYYDPVSKMLVAFSSDGTLHVAGDGSTQPRYQTTGITWGQLTNVVAVWDSNRKPTALYVNGVKPATGSTTTWSTGGTACAIGRRLGVGSGDFFNGSINEVKVFASQLTAADAQYIYNIGPNQNNWTPDEPVWLRVLHHNNPKGARFTTQEDAKDKDTADQFSKLKIFFNNDNFRRANGNYEFMAKEKLESGSTEQVFRWTQTSNPTASTVTGYKLISQTIDAGRNFGLKNNGSYAVFHNGNTWWCACGSWSAFNNGIPGFGGTVLTGYLDLYVRVDKVTLPAGYTELQYVQSDGTAYINAIVNGFNTADWEIYCKWMVTGWGVSYGYIFGAYSSENETSYRVILQNTDNDGYYVSSNCRAGSSIGVTNKAKNVIHTATLRDKSFDFDGVTYSAPTTGTAISTASTLCIFGRGSGTQNSKARVYELYGKKGGIPAFNLKPAKRDSDNAIGFYDLVNNRFVTKTGNGTLTGE